MTVLKYEEGSFVWEQQSNLRKEMMTRTITLAVVFALTMGFGELALAQHGPSFRGGFGHGSSGGALNMPGIDARGHGGSEMGLPTNPHSQQDLTEGNTRVTGRKTTSDLLSQNTKLSSKLQELLPTGSNVQDAAQGFDHLGQFVAAVHVSHNLGIPFDQLKTEMTGGSSLGEAIHKLRPDVDARQQAIKANQQALDDMEKSTASVR